MESVRRRGGREAYFAGTPAVMGMSQELRGGVIPSLPIFAEPAHGLSQPHGEFCDGFQTLLSTAWQPAVIFSAHFREQQLAHFPKFLSEDYSTRGAGLRRTLQERLCRC